MSAFDYGVRHTVALQSCLRFVVVFVPPKILLFLRVRQDAGSNFIFGITSADQWAECFVLFGFDTSKLALTGTKQLQCRPFVIVQVSWDCIEFHGIGDAWLGYLDSFAKEDCERVFMVRESIFFSFHKYSLVLQRIGNFDKQTERGIVRHADGISKW